MKKSYVLLVVAILALLLGACGSKDENSSVGPEGINAGATGATIGNAGQAGKMPAPGQGGQTTSFGGASGAMAGSGGGSARTTASAGGTGGKSRAGAGGNTGTAGNTGAAGTDSEFDACYATLKKCVINEMDTADKIGTPCLSMTNIATPLTVGGNHGPITIPMGPYGGKIEWNQGAGTEFVNSVNGSESICVPVGMDSFREPAATTDDLKNLRDLDYRLYTIFRPACFKPGDKYPVITWANGTCGVIHGYAPLLATVASYGFVIVASNSTFTATAPTDTVQLRALDYAKALNEDSKSIYYQKLDMDKIGAMGHSQGSMATIASASDSRIKALILWNYGTSNDKPFLEISGDRDVGGTTTPSSLDSGVQSATQPGAWVYHHQVLETGGTSTGHLVLMEEPERVVDMAVAWWKYRLNGDAEAKKMFVGDACGLCNKDDEFEYGHNNLLK
jgi:hypothetical protein